MIKTREELATRVLEIMEVILATDDLTKLTLPEICKSYEQQINTALFEAVCFLDIKLIDELNLEYEITPFNQFNDIVSLIIYTNNQPSYIETFLTNGSKECYDLYKIFLINKFFHSSHLLIIEEFKRIGVAE